MNRWVPCSPATHSGALPHSIPCVCVTACRIGHLLLFLTAHPFSCLQYSSPSVGCPSADSGVCTVLDAEYMCLAIRGGVDLQDRRAGPGRGEITRRPVSMQVASRPLTSSVAGATWYSRSDVLAYRRLLRCRLLAEWVQVYPVDTPAEPGDADLRVLLEPLSVYSRLSRQELRCWLRLSPSNFDMHQSQTLYPNNRLVLCRSTFLPFSWLAQASSHRGARELIGIVEGHGVARVDGPSSGGTEAQSGGP